MKRRSIVYVDGFNFYYGVIKRGPNKWLDIADCFTRIRQNDIIQKIHYFTTIVEDAEGKVRQQVYLRALASTPLVSIVLGKFKIKEVACRVAGCTHAGRRLFSVPAEKRTDVQIALQMLEDAYEDRCDLFVLVSGDSDLVPAVRRVLDRFPQKQVVVYVPARDPDRGAATELRNAASEARTFPLNLLRVSQFPARVPDGAGGFVSKPKAW